MQLGTGKYNVPTATESLHGESLSHKSFLGKFVEIWAKYPLHPPKIACSFPYVGKYFKPYFKARV